MTKRNALVALTAAAAVAALGGCGSEPEKKAKAPPAAQAFEAGQWQSSLEVFNFRRADEGRPRLNMPNGTRVEGAACIGPGDTTRPPPELFVGDDFTNCRWIDNFSMRNGRLVSGMTCRRAGVGEVEISVELDMTATSYQGTVQMLTRLVSDGDVTLSARAQGRRTGQCTAEEGAGNSQKAR
ncbi:MAG TPA: DUF3617 family protein [Allosphingosinicella sp.]|jgi:hypothetical protein